ncbi:helix-turn-helix domain-containing protein [Acinetobacter ursingii]|uniref:helix-turn-helix domain-containing protein n=1 Tax=Acinetobacter ursingii TaxID=108980 RepID=UPI0012501C95|nr:helix-turn-helix transcriptional regulator [Acinetobacter ursingii]
MSENAPTPEIQKYEAQKLTELYNRKKQLERAKGVNFTQKDIYESAGWSQPNVTAYFKGINQLKIDSALVFANALGCKVEDFSPRLAHQIKMQDIEKTQLRYIPILSPLQMDQIRNQLKDKSLNMPISDSFMPICQPISDNAFGIILPDASMSPDYPAGTQLIFDPEIKPNPTDLVYVGSKLEQGVYHVRQYNVIEITQEGQEVIEFTATNKSFPTLRHNFEVLGVAIAAVKNLR